MKFKRIDEETVRCILSEDDMKEHGVELEDFLNNRGKIQDFLHSIVEMAVEEVGYKAQGGMLSMQVTPLPKNALAVTFSESTDLDFKGLLEQMTEAAEEIEIENKEMEEEPQTILKPKKIKNQIPRPVRIYQFQTLAEVEEYSKVISIEKPIKSSLYKDQHGSYNLILQKGRLSSADFEEISRLASEYGRLLSNYNLRAVHIEEHDICILPKKAVNILKEL